eukprot:TRINITY_DN8087_c0_g1_i1.p1 TRINITY_DN8087_c0_g1~~TRINITY_DN8087_c0_g1_i1.p1  ORF type:complete len:148 (-),score=9.77 TRINITY_DN8087_c0_g1_i1:124-567(-)
MQGWMVDARVFLSKDFCISLKDELASVYRRLSLSESKINLYEADISNEKDIPKTEVINGIQDCILCFDATNITDLQFYPSYPKFAVCNDCIFDSVGDIRCSCGQLFCNGCARAGDMNCAGLQSENCAAGKNSFVTHNKGAAVDRGAV